MGKEVWQEELEVDMRVGSLVVCVDDNFTDNEGYFNELRRRGIVFPIKNKIYTIREFDDVDEVKGIRLEEIVNILIEFDDASLWEQSFKIDRFRELDTPTKINLENILKNELV